jgi:hypothetical protein
VHYETFALFIAEIELGNGESFGRFLSCSFHIAKHLSTTADERHAPCAEARGAGLFLFVVLISKSRNLLLIFPQPSQSQFLGMKFQLSIGAGEGNRTLVISLEGCIFFKHFRGLAAKL